MQQHCSVVTRPGRQAEYASTTIRYLADGTWQTWMSKSADWLESRQPRIPLAQIFPLSSVTLPLALTSELTHDLQRMLVPPFELHHHAPPELPRAQRLSPASRAFVNSLIQTPPTKKPRT